MCVLLCVLVCLSVFAFVFLRLICFSPAPSDVKTKHEGLETSDKKTIAIPDSNANTSKLFVVFVCGCT